MAGVLCCLISQIVPSFFVLFYHELLWNCEVVVHKKGGEGFSNAGLELHIQRVVIKQKTCSVTLKILLIDST